MTMPKDDPQPSQNAKAQDDGFFKLPQPIKHIFDKFPLITYPSNELPLRSRKRRDQNALYIFTTEEGARRGRPSFNPACLKWQTYLLCSGISHTLIPSNNHASPTGVLPFLLPASSPSPIPSNRLNKWVANKTSKDFQRPDPPIRSSAYTSLLDHRIRAAWLHALYLTPANFSIASRLYIQPASTSSIVHAALSHQLQSAAFTELLKLSPSATASTVSEEDIYTEVRLAFEALSTLLDDDEWFFGAKEPGLFDASLFAYSYLIMDRSGLMKWKDPRLKQKLEGLQNLVKHMERISERYYPTGTSA